VGGGGGGGGELGKLERVTRIGNGSDPGKRTESNINYLQAHCLLQAAAFLPLSYHWDLYMEVIAK